MTTTTTTTNGVVSYDIREEPRSKRYVINTHVITVSAGNYILLSGNTSVIFKNGNEKFYTYSHIVKRHDFDAINGQDISDSIAAMTNVFPVYNGGEIREAALVLSLLGIIRERDNVSAGNGSDIPEYDTQVKSDKCTAATSLDYDSHLKNDASKFFAWVSKAGIVYILNKKTWGRVIAPFLKPETDKKTSKSKLRIKETRALIRALAQAIALGQGFGPRGLGRPGPRLWSLCEAP